MSDSEYPPMEYRFGDDHDWKYRATFERDGFWNAMTAAGAVVDEAKVRITPDSISLLANDPANVAMVGVEIDCVKDASGAVEVGLNVYDIKENLPFAGDPPHEYELVLEHGDGVDTAEVFHSVGGTHEAGLFDPSTVHTPEHVGDRVEGYEQDVTLPAATVRAIIGPMAESEADYVCFDPEDGALTVSGMNRSGEELASFTMEVPVEAGDAAAYSADYLRNFMEALAPDGEVRVRFGHEQLLWLDSDAGMELLLASRVIDEDGYPK